MKKRKNLVLKSVLNEPCGYPAIVTLYVAHDAMQTYQRIARNYKMKPDRETFGALLLTDGGSEIGMLFYAAELTERDIAHEIRHCADCIMRFIGHDHCKFCSNEPYAYLTGYLAKWLRSKLKKAKLRIG